MTEVQEHRAVVGVVRRSGESSFRRAANFFYDNLPTGDRLGEFFYATWMLVVSVGILNSFFRIESPRALYITLTIAVLVNLTWGLIDGISVMYSLVIARAEADRMVHKLRTKRNDPSVREEAMGSFEDTIVGSLSPEEQAKVVDMIQAGAPEDPSRTKYKPTRANRHYAVAILFIELMTTVPVLLPLILIPTALIAVWVSRFVAMAIMILLGIAYARHTNRNPVLAGLFLGVLLFVVATGSWYLGW